MLDLTIENPTSRTKVFVSTSSKFLVRAINISTYILLKFAFPDGCIRFHRADFLDVFVNKLPKTVTSFGKRLVSYTSRENGIKLLFQDGSEAVCDLLVGCDGVKSVVRKDLFESLSKEGEQDLRGFIVPVFTGTIAYRGLIPGDRLPRNKNGCVHSALQRPMMVGDSFSLIRRSLTPLNAVLWKKQGRSSHDCIRLTRLNDM